MKLKTTLIFKINDFLRLGKIKNKKCKVFFFYNDPENSPNYLN